MNRLCELVGGKVTNGLFPHVSFTRPELSPCLAGLAERNAAGYQEALALVRLGQQRLQAQPRPDMPGFTLVDAVEIAREQRYRARLEQESRMRAAIARGEKLLPEGAGGD